MSILRFLAPSFAVVSSLRPIHLIAGSELLPTDSKLKCKPPPEYSKSTAKSSTYLESCSSPSVTPQLTPPRSRFVSSFPSSLLSQRSLNPPPKQFLKQANGLDLGKLLAAYMVYYNVIYDKISVTDASIELDELMTAGPKYNLWQNMIIGGLASAFIQPSGE